MGVKGLIEMYSNEYAADIQTKEVSFQRNYGGVSQGEYNKLILVLSTEFVM